MLLATIIRCEMKRLFTPPSDDTSKVFRISIPDVFAAEVAKRKEQLKSAEEKALEIAMLKIARSVKGGNTAIDMILDELDQLLEEEEGEDDADGDEAQLNQLLEELGMDEDDQI